MIIQFNTDNNINGSERLNEYFETTISESLSRFGSQITRLEVHLKDENSSKESLNDKRCMLEARVEGLQPIAVSSNANTIEQAVKGAVDKLKSALDTAIGKLRNH
ncbi:HPF/RaiA family ribosome-associated protein [Flavihumibacter sp. R14]|nr:HPF/RaiA family ribosome-associated protein [Flavihumibacter soli]